MPQRPSTRTALAATAACAALAVLSGCGWADAVDTDAKDPQPAASTSPSSEPAPTEPSAAESSSAPDQGASASTVAAAYLAGTTLHLPDGTTRTVEHAYYDGVFVGDTLIGRYANPKTGDPYLEFVGPDGYVARTVNAGMVAGDATGSAAAYVTDKGQLVLLTSDQPHNLGTVNKNAYVTAVTGGSACAGEAPTADCLIYLNDGSEHALVIRADGSEPDPVPGALDVKDATASGMVAVLTSAQDEGSCSEVRGDVSGRAVFSTCDYSLFDISADEKWISGSHAYLDGIGMGYSVILDNATGAEVARYTPEGGGFVSAAAWADDDHLLISAYDGGEWKLVSLATDDTTEIVATSGSSDEMDSYYRFITP